MAPWDLTPAVILAGVQTAVVSAGLITTLPQWGPFSTPQGLLLIFPLAWRNNPLSCHHWESTAPSSTISPRTLHPGTVMGGAHPCNGGKGQKEPGPETLS